MPNGKKICPHLPSQDSPKFTQICILGLKTNHLATQVQSFVLITGGQFALYVPI
jgi:hypothetical protein